MKYEFIVKIILNENYDQDVSGENVHYTYNKATKTDIKDYIREAVEHWGGQFHPNHPLFSAHIDKVTVKSVKQKDNSDNCKLKEMKVEII